MQPHARPLNSAAPYPGPPHPQDFDWEALAARRMEPPRRPQETDHAKRKMELEDAHRGDPEVPAMTPEEVRECEVRRAGDC